MTEIEKKKTRIVFKVKIDDWDTTKIISEYIPHTWDQIFKKTSEERAVIGELMKNKVLPMYQSIYPPKEKIFAAFDLCPLSKVRVVIVGQDPYPQDGKACGLSFSILPDDSSIPGSLKNIYKELSLEYPEFIIPSHGDLKSWARQGVLLLNVALHFSLGEPVGQNIGLWKPFYTKTIKALIEYNPNIIFVLWGDKAQKATLPSIGNTKSLVSGHPSPQAVNTGGNFIGNGHFKKVNQILESRGEEQINWQL